MSRAIVTLAVGPHVDLLAIALPSFREFADRHDYELIIADVDSRRPPSWRKIPALKAALDLHDEVLWIDADTVIIDPSEDLEVPGDAWQAMVAHHTNDGEVPNCGVWLVRQPMQEILSTVWTTTAHLNHPWWEQRVVVELMGYGGFPLTPVMPSELRERTHFLDAGWNVHRDDRVRSDRSRIGHATMAPDVAGQMREWASLVTA